jgi:hypothetical protein
VQEKDMLSEECGVACTLSAEELLEKGYLKKLRAVGITIRDSQQMIILFGVWESVDLRQDRMPKIFILRARSGSSKLTTSSQRIASIMNLRATTFSSAL